MVPRSLQARLLFAVGALALAAIALVALAARQGTRLEFLRFADLQRREQSTRLPELARRLRPQLDGRCCAREAVSGAAAALPAEAALLVVDARDGALIASAGASLAGDARLQTARHDGTLAVELTRRTGVRVNQVALRFRQPPEPLRLADGRDALLYVVPLPSDDRERTEAAFFGALDRRLLIAAAVVGLLALAATWAIVRGVTTPVAELQRATRDLAAGALARRVVPRGSHETIALGEAFNAMAGELERQEALRRDMVHDVAHELRTPLTDLRCRLETLIDGLAPDPRQAVRDLHDDVRHLGRLVDDLQDLAQADARALVLDAQAVDIDGAVRAALRSGGLDDDARVSIDLPPGIAVRADPDRVRQILVNLLTNAGRYCDHSGSSPGVICISAITSDDLPRVCRLTVRNTGRALAPEAVARLFDRFYRADPARGRGTGGSGLGLAIVKQLVEAQGGSVWAASDADSVTVGFSLPAAEATVPPSSTGSSRRSGGSGRPPDARPAPR
jgi:two-component system sensor histidine kinase BaeS